MKSTATSSVKVPVLPVLVSANELQATAFRLADESARSFIECCCMQKQLSGSDSDEFIKAKDFAGNLTVSLQLTAPKTKSGRHLNTKYDLSHVDSLARAEVQEAVNYLLGRQSNSSSTPLPTFRTNVHGHWIWFTAF